MKTGLILSLAACGSSPGAGPGGGATDASAQGDAGHGSGSGSGSDGTAPAGLVRIHALSTTGAPVAGLHAVFVDASSTMTDTVTDATGVAQATVSAGASVTLVCDHATHVQCPGAAALTTVQDLTPGDDVTFDVDAFGGHRVPLDPTPAGTFAISATGAPDEVGLHATYAFEGPCGAASLPNYHNPAGNFAFQTGCRRTSMNVVGRYYAGVGEGTGFYTAEQLDVPFVDGGSAVLSGPWVKDIPFVATYANVDATAASVIANRFLPDLRDTLSFYTARPGGGDVVSGAATSTFNHVGVATHAMVRTTFSTCTGAEIAADASNSIDCVATHPSQVTTDAIDGTKPSLSIDASAKLLPWVTAPHLVAANNVLTVPPPTGTGAYSVAEVDLGYRRDTGEIYTWRIFERQLGDVHLPALPSTLPTDPTPKAADTVIQTHAYLGRSSTITSWRDVVANPYEALGAAEASPDPTTKRFDVASAAFSSSGY